MKIQLLSDIHLEFASNSFPKIIDDVDLLILAGDIGLPHLKRYLEFLQLASQSVKHVILITGNHEYYHSKGYHLIDDKIRKLLKDHQLEENVHFLQRNWVDLNGIRVLGCTLWTHIPSEHGYIVEKYMNDYNRIKMRIIKNGTPRKVPIGHSMVNQWHGESCDWLREQVKESPYPVVIVTHHVPLLHLQDLTDSLTFGYHSDQLELLTDDKVKLWCFGHTHRAIQMEVESTLAWCNPVGYPKEQTNYNASGVVVIDVVEGLIKIEYSEEEDSELKSSSSSFHESDFE